MCIIIFSTILTNCPCATKYLVQHEKFVNITLTAHEIQGS